jgi:hypothetical protein
MQLERMMGTKVFLELFVKVQPNWRESRGFVEELDWRRQLEHLTGGQIELPEVPLRATHRPKLARKTRHKHTGSVSHSR